MLMLVIMVAMVAAVLGSGTQLVGACSVHTYLPNPC